MTVSGGSVGLVPGGKFCAALEGTIQRVGCVLTFISEVAVPVRRYGGLQYQTSMDKHEQEQTTHGSSARDRTTPSPGQSTKSKLFHQCFVVAVVNLVPNVRWRREAGLRRTSGTTRPTKARRFIRKQKKSVDVIQAKNAQGLHINLSARPLEGYISGALGNGSGFVRIG